MHCFLISTLAEYQTRFWLDVGIELQRHGHACAFLSFDDRSTDMLRQKGFEVFALSSLSLPDTLAPEDITGLFDAYGVKAPEGWFLHERMAYGEQNHTTLIRKLYASIQLADIAITQCKSRYASVSLVQEVGGFLSVVGGYFAARKAQVPNWFIEPAFFKGRLFFTRDSFAAPTIIAKPKAATLAEVKTYIDRVLQTQQIVIPEKDRHHYASALTKILNRHNLTRLVQKSIDKYLLGKKQEFGYLGRQVGIHARMLLNSMRLRNRYTPLSALQPFLYFPLHVPGDMALTIRSPEYVDQFALLEQVLRATPLTHQVVVKEHPAMIGALGASRFLDLLKRYPQFKLLPPSTNNYDVLRKADLIVSINSKSGAEALLLGKHVLVMGEAFYSTCPMIEHLDSPRQLADTIAKALASTTHRNMATVMDYFHTVWDSSLEGELYIADPQKVARFTQSLILAAGNSTTQKQPIAGAHV